MQHWQHLPANIDCLTIVACQRGGVSNEPPRQRQDTGPGILWSVHRWTRPTREPPTCGVNQYSTGFYCVRRRTRTKVSKLGNHLDKNLKKERTAHLIRLTFTKSGWAWHVTLYIFSHEHLFSWVIKIPAGRLPLWYMYNVVVNQLRHFSKCVKNMVLPLPTT